ncbi:1,2-phenylacetyl-CoA epoxidase subunit PaaB [Shewanella woodyi]|uniref:Phenylacetate-CoA oxygenase, PaaH subunit n=1 Tax=Shewanella woodyi (strain ATCC 51908 / MS32) TaxID=392500 RepID=B1KMA8_SHEWM|nr:1,2-phenylacetyl-CoA epoxidase subunit PaaB [Shewanella woodyi]ACA84521.1 phenylacetate-CoA oxygenase, PaaH subunit [Shewanella woodyi ATCC 51908]
MSNSSSFYQTSELYEVFIRSARGLEHKHIGSLHAESAEQAITYARDVYIRRSEGLSIWVVKSSDVHSSQESDIAHFYDPMDDKPYRHAQFVQLPDAIKNM